MGKIKPNKLTCRICNKQSARYWDDDGDGEWFFCSIKCWKDRLNGHGWGAIC